ncbi:MAG: hypothetical protein AAFR33_08335 [Pseudomonadota bacterium]
MVGSARDSSNRRLFWAFAVAGPLHPLSLATYGVWAIRPETGLALAVFFAFPATLAVCLMVVFGGLRCRTMERLSSIASAATLLTLFVFPWLVGAVYFNIFTPAGYEAASSQPETSISALIIAFAVGLPVGLLPAVVFYFGCLSASKRIAFSTSP